MSFAVACVYLFRFSRVNDEQYQQHDGSYHPSRAVIHLHGPEDAGQCDQKSGAGDGPQIIALPSVEFDAADEHRDD